MKGETIFIELNATFWKHRYLSLSRDDMDDLGMAIQNVLEREGYMSEMVYTLKDNDNAIRTIYRRYD